MKILMTGMSARSVGSTKIRYDFFNVPDLLMRVLTDEGHEVHMRVVDVDESDDLAEYDRVICQPGMGGKRHVTREQPSRLLAGQLHRGSQEGMVGR